MSIKAVKSFIKKLKVDDFRTQIAPSLLKVKEGDWKAVCDLAARHGFRFTPEELKAEMENYPGFFKGAGADPKAGWKKSTLAN
jgi:hypothetical protein